ncbi:MAG: EAL domain-containing protein [Alphaproteobacteria bacterium]
MATKSTLDRHERRQTRNEIRDPASVLAAHRRDIILEAIAQSAKELLHSTDLRRAICKVLECIATAMNFERAHLVAMTPVANSSDRKISDHFIWSASGVAIPERLRDGRGLLISELGIDSWVARWERGETIAGNTRQFTGSVRKFLELLSVRSTIAVPVFVADQWWGIVAFDACKDEREWASSEIDAFKILAELLGAAIGASRRQQKLADANRIIENSSTVLYRLGAQEPFPLTFVSQNISRYGHKADELLQAPNRWQELVEPADLAAALDNMKSIAEGRSERQQLDFRFKRADGTYAWFSGESAALYDAHGQFAAIEGIVTDITDRKAVSEALSVVARSDHLTGLPNRAAFVEQMQLAFARARRDGRSFALLYLDLDHFKDINDTLGHPAGDALLVQVAERLKSCVRASDVVSRFGGDEFAVLHEDAADLGKMEVLASKIAKALSRPFMIESSEVRVTSSIGIVPYDKDIEAPEAMMTKADLALYRAKHGGRNQFCFHAADLDEAVKRQMIISRDLHSALDLGEFELLYQPQVALRTQCITGLEALIRWRHPERGLLLPHEFIPIAESNGTIFSIGEWAINEACRQMRIWHGAALLPPLIAVNVSGAQFQFAGGLDGIVSAALQTHSLEPNCLELELTESVLFEATQRHRETFNRLLQIGVRIAIDDFGTGFSSIDYLRALRVTRLKLDRRFIDGVPFNSDDAAIMRAAAGIAHALGIELVAEGVNTEEQRAFLLSIGCEYAQGFRYGAPMCAEKISELLKGGD